MKNTLSAPIKYFHGLYEVIILQSDEHEDTALCRALYPVRDRLPRADFITELSGLTDELKHPRILQPSQPKSNQ